MDRTRSVDVDPECYPGQPETANAPVVGGVPTVLSKLQKWGDYESVGQPVGPTHLLPMKTPLSAEILQDWQLPEPPRHSLTIDQLLASQAAAGRRVGCIVDLSNHDCLYECDLPAGDFEYRHLHCIAKELPSRECIQRVATVVLDFARRRPDEYIGIHCAYGFNRTGFVVVSLLVECWGMGVDDALAAFALARPPGVKHERFRVELYDRYGGGEGGGGAAAAGGGGAARQPRAPFAASAGGGGAACGREARAQLDGGAAVLAVAGPRCCDCGCAAECCVDPSGAASAVVGSCGCCVGTSRPAAGPARNDLGSVAEAAAAAAWDGRGVGAAAPAADAPPCPPRGRAPPALAPAGSAGAAALGSPVSPPQCPAAAMRAGGSGVWGGSTDGDNSSIGGSVGGSPDLGGGHMHLIADLISGRARRASEPAGLAAGAAAGGRSPPWHPQPHTQLGGAPGAAAHAQAARGHSPSRLALADGGGGGGLSPALAALALASPVGAAAAAGAAPVRQQPRPVGALAPAGAASDH